MKTVAVFGSTGSIGVQTLNVVRRFPHEYKVVTLTAGSNVGLFSKQVAEFSPSVAACLPEIELPDGTIGFFGDNAAAKAAEITEADIYVMAISGLAALAPLQECIKRGKRVALANKEAIVCAGEIVLDSAAKYGTEIIPVDSEHSAVFQCLKAGERGDVRRIVLTASGGPFYSDKNVDLSAVTPEQAVRHPTWNMGAKISVDSATMVNKGLEIIEAGRLFSTNFVDYVIHPESVIHSMVEFADGAVLAQLGAPDMRVPIGYALGEPDRLAFGGERLDFTRMGALTFASPDTERFPCLAYAREALRLGGSAPVVLNGANEEAVAAFLRGEAKFGQIPLIVRYALDHAELKPISCAQEVYEADARARLLARACLRHL